MNTSLMKVNAPGDDNKKQKQTNQQTNKQTNHLITTGNQRRDVPALSEPYL